MRTLEALNAQILAAHKEGEPMLLAHLYCLAGKQKLAERNIDEAAFFLTQAYIFALEIGATDAEQIAATLIKMGRL